MKAGFIQFAPVLGDAIATLSQIENLLAVAAEADLLVLPELCHSGYRFRDRREALAASETVADSALLRFVETFCSRRKCHVVAGFNERDSDRLYNTAVLVGPNGMTGKYRKLHLFLDEKDIFTPGDLGLPVFEIGSCKLGLLICFDWYFPEAWRALALKGAEIICHPSNLVIPGLCQRAVPTHAICNRVFIITANRTGTERDLTFTGRSIIVNPRGDVLHEALPDRDEAFVADIDLSQARDKWITPRNHALEDRRPTEYVALIE